ncbi:acyl-CoA carboxylase subunit epsilon [Streptomyces albus subsp. chlorinus]|uniref:acyl-CoA carboxylase subunit epsilon n=1 Tax=Streptomyces albus TaxID=1888 RepID=UPI00156EEE88|nr:acyl-CoA carboxylase subunit epsilon [Streptomyces albus]NSC23574.1 acyl-CoA carboxylase subunit epsilon [Streptomyces albus subsp. chlorinus]
MTTQSPEPAPQGAEPSIRVVRGNPTPEELAAALAVVRVRAAAVEPGQPGGPAPSAWSDPARTMPRRTPAPGPGAWRRTFWPG